ncbi:MAG TPA: tetratricopeptide repeat protein, partial [Candidatus Acidoferrales bacterium]|nr:tetratricopeptide repeat protein [Candidatus Acidoferrales bacterium]
VQSGRQGMADRYAYIPLIGIFIAVIWAFGEYASRIRIADRTVLAVFVVAILPYVCVTEKQIGYWRNSRTLFEHAIAVTKNNGIAENNLGAAFMEQREPRLAKPHFEAAVRLIPDFATAHYNLGVANQLEGQSAKAHREYELAISLFSDPLEAEHAYHNLAVLDQASKMYGLALAEIDKAIASNPSQQNNYILRGKIELETWNYDGAAKDFALAVEIAPTPDAYFYLGQALEAKGDPAAASSAYVNALQRAPGMAQARARLEALQNKGRAQ